MKWVFFFGFMCSVWAVVYAIILIADGQYEHHQFLVILGLINIPCIWINYNAFRKEVNKELSDYFN